MSDVIAEIEVELRRGVVTEEQANDQRKRLRASFARLGQDQAVTLLARILTLGNDRLPVDFRRLHRAVRLELMQRLVMLLGTQRVEQFRAALAGAGDTPLKKGLIHAFPDHAISHRERFLKSLDRGLPVGTPQVRLEFRNRDRFTVDNKAPSIARGFVRNILGPLPDTGINQMEIRGTIIGHRPDAEYRFGRTIEKKRWKRIGGTWSFFGTPVPAGTDDDSHDNDEDTHADNDHIYSIDSPGFTGSTSKPDLLDNLPSAERSTITEAVFMMNATETLEIRVGQGAFSPAGEVDWFSVTWLEKVDNSWRRKDGSNKIEAGSLNGLDSATEPDRVKF